MDQCKFDVWVGLGGQRPTNAEMAEYIRDYIDNQDEDIDSVTAEVLRHAATVLGAA